MANKLMTYITNPATCKLILDVQELETATAKILAERNPQIAQATLYRQLKKMVADGVLKVVEENRVRNVIEKVYAINLDLNREIETMLAENSGETYFHLFQQFTIGLLGEFQTYAAQPDINLTQDGSGFNTTPFHATLEELTELAQKIRDVIKPYRDLPATPERQTRQIAIIYTPPTKEKK